MAQIKYNTGGRNRNIAIQVLAYLKKGGKKSHLCVSFISLALGAEGERLSAPPPCWVELTLKHQFLNTEPSRIAEFSSSPSSFFFFFLS